MPVGNAAVNPTLFPDLPYRLDQFAPVTQIANVENVLVVSAKLPVKTVAELIALGKQKDLTYATPGAGSIAHLAAELFARTAGFRVDPCGLSRRRTGADRRAARRDRRMMFAQVSTAKPLIDSGELRALGVASAKRSAALPDVPTIAESGMPGFEAVSWYALMAPAGTPDAVIAKLREGVIAAINAPEAKAALAAQGAQPVGNTPAELAAVIAADTARWAKVIREADIKVAP